MPDIAMPISNSIRPTLLLIDDDCELCELVSRYLATEGFDSTAVHTGGEGERAALTGSFDLIVLDVMLPDCKGFDVLREIRKSQNTPVLMLTAKGDSYDRILGLELGADDYVAKPFNSRELSARISAILRRSNRYSVSNASQRPATVMVGDLELDPSGRGVTKAGQEMKLTSAEFDLLRLFLESAGEILSRETLVEQVLGKKYSPFERSIDFHISNLKRKLGPEKNGRERIRSVRGTGYLYAWPRA